jgi:hypothetical protein
MSPALPFCKASTVDHTKQMNPAVASVLVAGGPGGQRYTFGSACQQCAYFYQWMGSP